MLSIPQLAHLPQGVSVNLRIFRAAALVTAAGLAVKIVGTFPADSHPPIIYPVAATTTAKPEAADYLAFLRSAASKTILEKYGFNFLVSPTT